MRGGSGQTWPVPIGQTCSYSYSFSAQKPELREAGWDGDALVGWYGLSGKPASIAGGGGIPPTLSWNVAGMSCNGMNRRSTRQQSQESSSLLKA